jgi:hypothetical protein
MAMIFIKNHPVVKSVLAWIFFISRMSDAVRLTWISWLYFFVARATVPQHP